MSTTTTPALMTAEEFAEKHGGDYVELIDGVVEPIPMPFARHGQVCVNPSIYIGGYIKQNNLGQVCSNDTFVVVRRNPDRVRGGDVVYWSREKLPGGEVPKGLVFAPPDLCVEVVSPSNDWSEVFTKVGEYLKAGVTAVVVLDPDSATASV